MPVRSIRIRPSSPKPSRSEAKPDMAVQQNYGTGRRKSAVARVYLRPGKGDIVVNADKLRVSGNKNKDKLYHRHSGYPGGLYTTSFEKLQAKHPERVLRLAVKGMLPKGPLGYAMIKKMKVYAGAEHPHSAQQPKTLQI